jgi:hypothetical protein
MEAVMSANATQISPIVVLKMPKAIRDFITRAKVINVALLGNKFFPNPTPSLDVLAEDIAALEEAETKVATRAIGTAALRDGTRRKVQDDLDQHRGYVQSVVSASADPCEAAAMIESAAMCVRKPKARNTPAISAKNADVSGKVILAAKSLGPSVMYSWEYSLDQATWTPIPDTMRARTEVSGLQSACTYYFRFSTFTRAGHQGYSQVVSLLVH